ncbi:MULTISPECIES: LuxR family transcriptional regulator [Streptomyces]|uniref:LuxR family transcriptional regulator n=1 Tax=Streptomyces lycii TaxID=2654337 RepID=A0ABQ7F8V9_9ACTN|nr:MULTISPECIES: LuxR family transcriptional regulator [Streptomyces]KAF4405057.1 LuxR family transcriptional regulator [Streptomyces lycii]PGH47680.1 LuxR family transcriptional regulator [Streptomyces sp. Ru87]
MEKISLRATAEEQLGAAHQASAGRSAVTAVGDNGGRLRQTVIALRGGERPTEHESPGEATVLVLTGRVRVSAGEEGVTEGTNGDLIVLPDDRHSLEVLEDSVVLLTVAKP